ncbi:LuxR family transcriptional regulator [Burkholderia mayonis]|uniref:LuxR family transcriptional regulator n=1 Tax=Burkholderia mayonis TaxID=1385591 RepID=A0A1B4FIC3_9BURK|nr:LuxR family transcriptional regulator [Burkholderia mayonis]KVE49973.1 LuxR family transcriptional regulator [Burkholderia mayonis]
MFTEGVTDHNQTLNILYQTSSARTERDTHDILSRITAKLGFDYFFYGTYSDIDRQESPVKTISNYPTAWQEKYKSSEYIRADSIVQHCGHCLIPLRWHDGIRHSREQRNFMEDALGHGLVAGANFPVHSRHGEAGILSLASRSAGGTTSLSAKHAPTTFAQRALAAAFVREDMERISNRPDHEPAAPLTHRKFECLKWIAAGKSSWEIAMIPGISENGVLYHMKKLMAKFDVQSRHLAVLKAMASGVV